MAAGAGWPAPRRCRPTPGAGVPAAAAGSHAGGCCRTACDRAAGSVGRPGLRRPAAGPGRDADHADRGRRAARCRRRLRRPTRLPAGRTRAAPAPPPTRDGVGRSPPRRDAGAGAGPPVAPAAVAPQSVVRAPGQVAGRRPGRSGRAGRQLGARPIPSVSRAVHVTGSLTGRCSIWRPIRHGATPRGPQMMCGPSCLAAADTRRGRTVPSRAAGALPRAPFRDLGAALSGRGRCSRDPALEMVQGDRAAARPSRSSAVIQVWVGCRRRSVGEPGLSSRSPVVGGAVPRDVAVPEHQHVDVGVRGGAAAFPAGGRHRSRAPRPAAPRPARPGPPRAAGPAAAARRCCRPPRPAGRPVPRARPAARPTPSRPRAPPRRRRPPPPTPGPGRSRPRCGRWVSEISSSFS